MYITTGENLAKMTRLERSQNLLTFYVYSERNLILTP